MQALVSVLLLYVGACLGASDDSQGLPIVDFGKFLKGDEDDRLAVGRELYDILTTSGFFLIKNFGIEQEVIDRVFAASKEFFDLDLEFKMKFEKQSDPEGGDCQGFVHNSELVYGLKPDYKELFDFDGANWKRAASEHRYFHDKGVHELWMGMYKLSLELYKAYALALELPEDFFLAGHTWNEGDDWLDSKPQGLFRMLMYPPLPASSKEIGQGMCAPHTDYQSITLLLQDEVGGLEVWNKTGREWISATPVPGTLVVNTANLIQRWSNDLFVSTMHRVVPNVNNQKNTRYSIVWFSGANSDYVADPMDVFKAKVKYGPISSGEHWYSQMADLYHIEDGVRLTEEYGNVQEVDMSWPWMGVKDVQA